MLLSDEKREREKGREREAEREGGNEEERELPLPVLFCSYHSQVLPPFVEEGPSWQMSQGGLGIVR